jgi:hypothetical protein
MRKTIILGSILALVGFTAVAQASDWSKVSDRDATRVHREVSDDSRGDRMTDTSRKTGCASATTSPASGGVSRVQCMMNPASGKIVADPAVPNLLPCRPDAAQHPPRSRRHHAAGFDAFPSQFGIGRLAHRFDLNQSASEEPPDRYVACLGYADYVRGPARNKLQPMHHNLIQ